MIIWWTTNFQVMIWTTLLTSMSSSATQLHKISSLKMYQRCTSHLIPMTNRVRAIFPERPLKCCYKDSDFLVQWCNRSSLEVFLNKIKVKRLTFRSSVPLSKPFIRLRYCNHSTNTFKLKGSNLIDSYSNLIALLSYYHHFFTSLFSNCFAASYPQWKRTIYSFNIFKKG